MILEAKNLEFAYRGGRTLFRDASFTLSGGEALTVLGPNGAGKSTLLNCACGLLKPRRGEVLLDGKNVSKLSARRVARIIGLVPQTHVPVYSYTVRDFVVMGRAPHLSVFGTPSKADYAMADEVLARMNLTRLADRSCADISGGERQQASIVRAMVQNPDIMMLDEPAASLDLGNQLRVLRMLKDLSLRGYGIVMTTHAPDHAILLGGRVAVLDDRGNFRVGEADDMLREDLLSDLYEADLRVAYVKEVGRKVCAAGNLEGGGRRETPPEEKRRQENPRADEAPA